MPKLTDRDLGILNQAGQLVDSLQAALRTGGQALHEIPMLLRRLLAQDRWMAWVVGSTGQIQRYQEFEQFVTAPMPAGLATNVPFLTQLCRVGDDPAVCDLIDRICQRDRGNPNWVDSELPIVDIVNNSSERPARPTGNSREQALRRLRKDRPDLHADVLAGKKPHAAMVEAGFREKKIAVPPDPERAAQALIKHFDRIALRRVAEILGKETGLY